MDIPISKLKRCPIQLSPVRKETLEFAVLRNSIRDRGLLCPLLVRPVGDHYEVVDGNHRYEAVFDLKWETVPCSVKQMSDAEVLEIQIEAHGSIPRKRVDYARRLWKIVNVDQNRTIQELAYGIHRTEDWVKNTLTLIRLSPDAQAEVDGGRLPLSCAYELAKLPPTMQEPLLALIGKVSTKELKHLAQDKVRQFNQGKKDARIQQQMVDKVNLRGYIRSMREVERELEEPTVAASIIHEMGAETKLEVWRACLMWVLRRDHASVAGLRRKLSLELENQNE